MKHFLAPTKLMKRLSYLCLFIFLGLSIFGILSLKHLQTQYSVMQFLPSHHPALAMDLSVRDKFHLVDRPTFIGLLDLPKDQQWFEKNHMDSLSKVTSQLKNFEGVHDAFSLANIEGANDVDGTLSVGKIVKLIPESQWRSRFLNDKLLSPALVSADAHSTLVYVQLNDANVDLLARFQQFFRKTLKENFPDAQTSVGGVPAVQTDLGLLLNKELLNFLILTILSCALTLALMFRTLSTMAIPLVLTAFSNIMVFAMMAWTKLPFTILSATIPILVFITVVSISAHILLRLHEDAKMLKGERSKWNLILQANRSLLFPNFLGALTTCVGFLTLLFNDVPLIRNYGIAVASAIMMSWLLTSVVILPLLLLLPLPEPRNWVQKPARWALLIVKYRRKVVLSTLAVCVLLSFLGRHLDWSGRLFDDLPEGQEARQSTEKIDSSMGGVVPLELVIQVPQSQDWSDPLKIAKLHNLAEEFRQTPGVGLVSSVPDLIRTNNTFTLPKSRSALAEIYFLFNLAGNSPLEQYMTPDGHSTRVELHLRDLPADKFHALLSMIEKKAQIQFPEGQVSLGGMGAVVHLIHDEISRDLIFGFWQALGIIMLILAFIFRSLRWALVACLPNLIPPIVLLGYLALTHTPIKPGVAIIFSIALGLAFNNTVYVLNRLQKLTKNRNLPVTRAFYMEGNPCLVSTLIVMIGFSVFLFSYFSLNRTFGACMLVSIVGGLVGDLVFLPALLKMYPALLMQKNSPRIKIENDIATEIVA